MNVRLCVYCPLLSLGHVKSLHVCMYGKILYTRTCMYVCMYVCMRRTCIHAHARMLVCVDGWIGWDVCMYVRMYACMYICMHMRVCVSSLSTHSHSLSFWLSLFLAFSLFSHITRTSEKKIYLFRILHFIHITTLNLAK